MAGTAGIGGMTPQQLQQAVQGVLQSAPQGAPWGAMQQSPPQGQGPMGPMGTLGGQPGGCPPWQPNCQGQAGGGGGWGQSAMGRGARGALTPQQMPAPASYTEVSVGPGGASFSDDSPWR